MDTDWQEWEKLCQEYRIAKDAQQAAFLALIQQFKENEISHFEKTWEDLEEAKRRMSEFIASQKIGK